MSKTRIDRPRKSQRNITFYAKLHNPVIIVPKKKDLMTNKISYRMVVYFRMINEQLRYCSYPLIGVDRIFLKLHGAKLFTTLDVRSSYYNIMVAKEDRKFNCIYYKIWKIEGSWIPFGIHIAPSYFALMINEALKGLEFCFAYLDNIITLQLETNM